MHYGAEIRSIRKQNIRAKSSPYLVFVIIAKFRIKHDAPFRCSRMRNQGDSVEHYFSNLPHRKRMTSTHLEYCPLVPGITCHSGAVLPLFGDRIEVFPKPSYKSVLADPPSAVYSLARGSIVKRFVLINVKFHFTGTVSASHNVDGYKL